MKEYLVQEIFFGILQRVPIYIAQEVGRKCCNSMNISIGPGCVWQSLIALYFLYFWNFKETFSDIDNLRTDLDLEDFRF